MPDPNKHASLAARGFSIAKVCATCKWWSKESYRAPTDWGKCTLAVYKHYKHSGFKTAGTPSFGTCRRHDQDDCAVDLRVGEDYAHRYGRSERCG